MEKTAGRGFVSRVENGSIRAVHSVGPSFSTGPCSLPSAQPCVPAPRPPDSARPCQAPILPSLGFSSLLLPSLRPWTIGMFSLIPPASVSTSDGLLFWNPPPLVKGSLVPPGIPQLSGAQSMSCLPTLTPLPPLHPCSSQTGQLVFQTTPYLSHLQTLEPPSPPGSPSSSPEPLGMPARVRSVSAVLKVGADTVPCLLSGGCVLGGGWANSLPVARMGRGQNQSCHGNPEGLCRGGGRAVFGGGRDPGLQQRPMPRAGRNSDPPRQPQRPEFSHPRCARPQGSPFQATACSLGTQRPQQVQVLMSLSAGWLQGDGCPQAEAAWAGIGGPTRLTLKMFWSKRLFQTPPHSPKPGWLALRPPDGVRADFMSRGMRRTATAQSLNCEGC